MGESKRIVKRGYDACATEYNRARSNSPPMELLHFGERLQEGAVVLDIGCGAGDPVIEATPATSTYTGVDLSAAQIEIARSRHPDRGFVLADIMDLEIEPCSLDAIVSLYAIFHLPITDEVELIRRASKWLRDSGYLFATLSDMRSRGYTESDFFGATFWAHLTMGEYVEELRGAGFEIVETGILGHGYEDLRPEERHPFATARLMVRGPEAEPNPQRL